MQLKFQICGDLNEEYLQGTGYALYLSGLSKILLPCRTVYNSKAKMKLIWGYHSLSMKVFVTSHVASVWAAMLLQEQYDMEKRNCPGVALASCVGHVAPELVSQHLPLLRSVGECTEIWSRPTSIVTMSAKVEPCFRIAGEQCMSILCYDPAQRHMKGNVAVQVQHHTRAGCG